MNYVLMRSVTCGVEPDKGDHMAIRLVITITAVRRKGSELARYSA
jgi:hypothetical protein